jgi:predicted AAA+ superfamily ATPase
MTKKRLLNLRRDTSYFLLGPRGTGKTTYLKESFPDYLYLNLLEKSLYFDLLKEPDRIKNIIGSSNKHIIIDEVQKIPDLLDIVHRLIEEEKKIFILTGSSARKLKKANTNFLAGRALNAKMFPLTSIELGDDFNFEKAITFGMLPALYDENKNIPPKEYLETYVDTYLKEEVHAEG